MQWLSSRPSGLSRDSRNEKYAGRFASPMCSVRPMERHGVELLGRHVPVVQEPHLGEVVDPRLDDGLLRPRRLGLGERDAKDADAVLARRVDHHAAPAAADVQQAHARLERRACARRGRTSRTAPPRATPPPWDRSRTCRPSRAEHPGVEQVGHVVVVRDRLGVAASRVPADERRPGVLLGREARAAERTDATGRLDELLALLPRHGPRSAPRSRCAARCTCPRGRRDDRRRTPWPGRGRPAR